MYKAHASRIIIYYDAGDVELSPIRRSDAKTCFPSTQAGPSRKVGDDTTKTIAVRRMYLCIPTADSLTFSCCL